MNNERFLNGYRLIYKQGHPCSMKSKCWNGWIYEHRYLAEDIIGRPLNENEEVHHLDCDRSNNRIENLLVLEKSQHKKIHGWLDRGAPVDESYRMNGVNSVKSKVNSYCLVCGATLQQKERNYCSVKCAAKGRQRVERPNKDELKKLIETHSFLALGKMFGVSDNAVRKWAKKYELL